MRVHPLDARWSSQFSIPSCEDGGSPSVLLSQYVRTSSAASAIRLRISVILDTQPDFQGLSAGAARSNRFLDIRSHLTQCFVAPPVDSGQTLLDFFDVGRFLDQF